MAVAGSPKPQRLLAISGFEDRANDVLYTPARDQLNGHVIFFGGDIQDYPENMMAHRDNRHYVDWNLENTATILGDRFPSHHIWIVKPCHMDLKTFSVYSNFVEFTDIGNPEHSEGQSSWLHLSALMKNAFRTSQDPAEAAREDFFKVPPLTLIGFSKGCVVLNQFLYDLGKAKLHCDTSEFVSKVSRMYWLDGGHNGGSKTWVTDEDVLHNLVDTDIEVVAHVTPYQVKDSMRKWLGKEHKRFVERLKKMGVVVHDTVHFADEDRSIENHFKVLTVF